MCSNFKSWVLETHQIQEIRKLPKLWRDAAIAVLKTKRFNITTMAFLHLARAASDLASPKMAEVDATIR
jgi:hypothetical protein